MLPVNTLAFRKMIMYPFHSLSTANVATSMTELR